MLKNLSIIGTARVLPAVTALVQSVVVARQLGPEALGIVALISAYPALVFGVLNVRTVDTTTRYLAAYDTKGEATRALGLCSVAYLLDSAVAVAALVVVLATASVIGPYFIDDAQWIPTMMVYALSFVPSAFMPTSTSVLVVTGRFAENAVLDIATAALRALLVVTLVVLGHGIPGVVYGTIVANGLGGVCALALAHRAGSVRWGGSWMGRGLADLAGQRREIARLFVLSDLTGLFGMVVKTADVLLLALFRPTVEIGYYRLAKSLSVQIIHLVNAVRVVSFPQVVRLWTLGDWDGLWSYVKRHTWWTTTLGLAGAVVVALLLEPAIVLVYGPDFLPAERVAVLLLVQVVLVLATLWIDMVFFAWGDMHILLVARGAGAALVVGSIVALSGRFGIDVGAWALAGQHALATVITGVWMYRQRQARLEEAAEARAKRAGP